MKTNFWKLYWFTELLLSFWSLEPAVKSFTSFEESNRFAWFWVIAFEGARNTEIDRDDITESLREA